MQHYEYGLPYGAGYNDGWKEAQKKLLEYQREICNLTGETVLCLLVIETMLKQLEENNE
jgi:hypothetical protein